MPDIAEVHVFEEWQLSGKGLMARIHLPVTGEPPATRDVIQAIVAEVYNISDGGAPVTVNLVVADTMFNVAQTWSKDDDGFYFLWSAPGTLWPLGGKSYRIVLKFEIINPCAAYPTIAGQGFTVVFQNDAKLVTG